MSGNRHLTYVLKDKCPQTLDDEKKIVVEVEQNLNVAQIDMFNYPRTKIESKPKLESQDDPIIQAFAQKLDRFTIESTHGQKALMNRKTVVEMNQASNSNFLSRNQFNKDKSFPRKATKKDHTT